MQQELEPFRRCAACDEERPTWRLLRFSCAPEHIPERAVTEGGFDRHVDGHLPVCGRCVPRCPTCDAPVATLPVEQLLKRLRRTGQVDTRWFFEPCSAPSHERPALEAFPPDPTAPVFGPPAPPREVPGWSFLIERLPRFGIGDYVTVENVGGIGRVRYIRSVRAGHGTFVTVGYPDGTSISRRPNEVQRAGGLRAQD